MGQNSSMGQFTGVSRTKWLPVQRKRRRSHDIGINSKRNGLRSSPALSVARAILKRLAVCTVVQDFGIGHGERSDVKRHVETEGHRNAVVDAKQTKLAGRYDCLSDDE